MQRDNLNNAIEKLEVLISNHKDEPTTARSSVIRPDEASVAEPEIPAIRVANSLPAKNMTHRKLAHEILSEIGKPLHVDKIYEYFSLVRPKVTASHLKYVLHTAISKPKRGEKIVRTAPATYEAR